MEKLYRIDYSLKDKMWHHEDYSNPKTSANTNGYSLINPCSTSKEQQHFIDFLDIIGYKITSINELISLNTVFCVQLGNIAERFS